MKKIVAGIDIEFIRKFVQEDKFIISNHARVRMFQRNISSDDIRYLIMDGEIIEEYPEDEPCPSTLILGFWCKNPYHVVVAQCEDHVRIVTVYHPEEDKWIDYKIRRNRG